jgi:phage terminase large subunit-like protein
VDVTEREVAQLGDLDLAFLGSETAWLERARDKQVLPVDGWSLAIARSGRGWGKTDTGANWARRECWMYPGIVLHAVAPSHADLLGTMFQGRSGLLACTPAELIEATNFSAAIPTIKFKNGSLIRGFSSQSPDRLRGPQGSRVWGDEIAAWEKAEETLMNIDMSTRIAHRTADGRLVQPQRFYTSTPKPLKWLADLLKKAQIVIDGSTHENKANLADDFVRDLELYRGTKIYEQEVLGKLLDVSEAAVIKRSWLRLWPNERPLPWFDFIIVSLDTAFSEKTFDRKSFEPDPTACSVWGVFAHDRRWNAMLLECWKDNLGFPDLVKRTKRELKTEYGRRREALYSPVLVGQPETYAEQVKRPDLLIIEDKGSGISLRQMLSNEGIDSWPYNPGRADKLARLHAVSHVAASGRIWLPESDKRPGTPRNWMEPYLDEVCVYSGPGTVKHDDWVDTTSQAWRYFADRWLNAGVDGVIRPDSQLVNVNIEGVDRAEWVENDDQRVGQSDEEPLENWYG